MSRKTLILIAIILTFLATRGLAFDVRPQDASGYPGETVIVSINVTGAREAIDAIGMDLIYDPACLSFESLLKTALTANYYMLAPNELEPGRLRIGGFGVDVPDDPSDTTLVNLNFKIREEASGYCEISLSGFVADLKGATTNPAGVTIYSVPSPPDNLRTASISFNKIELAWQDNSLNETGFILERKIEGGTYLQIAEISTNVPTFSDTDVNPNTRYYYRIKACSNSACSSYSNEISPATSTQDATPPLSFNLLLPENDSWISDSSPTFAWCSSDDLESVLDGYFLYLDESLDTSLPPTIVSTKPSAPLLDGSYIWKVQAKNVQGLTTSSDTSLVKIDTIAPTTNLNIGSPSYNKYIKPTTPLSFLTNDQGSGISSVSCQINGENCTSPITISKEGKHSISCQSTDVAGNEGAETFTVFVDQTPPVTSDDAPLGWRSDTVTVTLTSGDTGCGVDSTYYTVNEDTPSNRGNRIDLDQDGIYKISYFSVDNLGNTETPRHTEVKINRFPPKFLSGYFDPKKNQLILHFSESIREDTGAQIKINGKALTKDETISETEGGKTLIVNLKSDTVAVFIEFDEGSIRDLEGNPILDLSEHLLYLLVEEKATLKGLTIKSLLKPLAFRCKDESQIDTTLSQIIQEANGKAEADPKISKMIGAAYQIEAITPQGEGCGENLGGLILLEIPYEEENNIESLRAYRLNEESCQWELIEDKGINEPDRLNKVVKVEVAHLSVISLGIARQAAPDLTGAKVFPNPFIPGSAVYDALKITFRNLTLDAEIKIFTIAGELVKTLRAEDGEATWKAVNENEREVASGIYIYLITDSNGEKKTGKIAIIR